MFGTPTSTLFIKNLNRTVDRSGVARAPSLEKSFQSHQQTVQLTIPMHPFNASVRFNLRLKAVTQTRTL